MVKFIYGEKECITEVRSYEAQPGFKNVYLSLSPRLADVSGLLQDTTLFKIHLTWYLLCQVDDQIIISTLVEHVPPGGGAGGPHFEQLNWMSRDNRYMSRSS